jgi:MFS family permease
MLYSQQELGGFFRIELVGAVLAAIAMPVSGWVSDRIGRRKMLAAAAIAIAIFSLAAPWLLGGGGNGPKAFILVGDVLLGLSYAQAAGSVTSNFLPRFRYTGAALTADLAWLIGAAFAPLVALALSARLGLGALSVYLLSGAVCTLVALRTNFVAGEL